MQASAWFEEMAMGMAKMDLIVELYGSEGLSMG